MNAKLTDESVTRMDTLIAEVCERLAQNQRVRRNLPGNGRLRFDRQLPFLCVYRSPPDRDDAGTVELVTTEAAYLFSSGDHEMHSPLSDLCCAIGQTMRNHFGVFLYVEVWSAPRAPGRSNDFEMESPAFTIHTTRGEPLPTAVSAFEGALRKITFRRQPASVDIVTTSEVAPPGLPALSASCRGDMASCFWIGLAVYPFYRSATNGAVYPIVLRNLRRQLAPALRQLFFAFSGNAIANAPTHYEALGPSSLVRATSEVDRQLCDVSQSFDLLLQVTPVNANSAWREFQRSCFRTEPTFYYRPLPYKPHMLKEKLFRIAIDRPRFVVSTNQATCAATCTQVVRARP